MIDPSTRPYGAAWYAAMLKGSKMQGPLGSTESTHINGTYISPVLTWDSKITTVLAFSGGFFHITRQVLINTGQYARFTQVVQNEWSRVFGNGTQLQGTTLPFALPVSTVPNVLPMFTACNGTSPSATTVMAANSTAVFTVANATAQMTTKQTLTTAGNSGNASLYASIILVATMLVIFLSIQ